MATKKPANEGTRMAITRRSGRRDPERLHVAAQPKLDPDMAASLREATTLIPDSVASERHPLYRLRLMIVASLFVVYSYALGGFIFERTQILLWLLITLVVANFGKTRGAILSVVRDWAPIFPVVFAYDFSRGAADTLGFPIQWDLPADFDRALFGELPTIRLQRWLNIGTETQWWEAIPTLVYVTHFFVPYLLLAGLWYRSRDVWRRYFGAFVILSFAGIATYIVLPTAPPWLASQEGLIGEITRSTNNGWEHMGLSVASRVINTGQAAVNDVAALPSLHAAFSALPAFALWSRSRRPVQALLLVYPLAMAFSIVSSGEHYVFDVLVGWCYAGLSVAVANRLADRKGARNITLVN